MRLPVTAQLSSRDGTSNKNARLTNMLKESKNGGDKAVIRPGLVESQSYSGLGSGLIAFDGRILTIVDNTVYLENYTWMDLGAADWDASASYSFGDFVWYGGSLWGALGANTGQTPFLNSTHWETVIAIYDWDEAETYATGDAVVYDGDVYYYWGYTGSNQNPASNPTLWRIVAPNLNITMGTVSYTPANVGLGGSQSAEWTYYLDGSPVGSGSGSLSTTIDGDPAIASMTASSWPRESTSFLGGIGTYSAMPPTPPNWVFGGSTQWSGAPGWDNFAWSPTQSGGSWVVANP